MNYLKKKVYIYVYMVVFVPMAFGSRLAEENGTVNTQTTWIGSYLQALGAQVEACETERLG